MDKAFNAVLEKLVEEVNIIQEKCNNKPDPELSDAVGEQLKKIERVLSALRLILFCDKPIY